MQIGEVVTLVKIDHTGRMTSVTGRVTGLAESYHSADSTRVQISELSQWFETSEWVQTK